MPRKVADQIVADVDDFSISLEEAKRLRLEMMEK